MRNNRNNREKTHNDKLCWLYKYYYMNICTKPYIINIIADLTIVLIFFTFFSFFFSPQPTLLKSPLCQFPYSILSIFIFYFSHIFLLPLSFFAPFFLASNSVHYLAPNHTHTHSEHEPHFRSF